MLLKSCSVKSSLGIFPQANSSSQPNLTTAIALELLSLINNSVTSAQDQLLLFSFHDQFSKMFVALRVEVKEDKDDRSQEIIEANLLTFR